MRGFGGEVFEIGLGQNDGFKIDSQKWKEGSATNYSKKEQQRRGVGTKCCC